MAARRAKALRDRGEESLAIPKPAATASRVRRVARKGSRIRAARSTSTGRHRASRGNRERDHRPNRGGNRPPKAARDGVRCRACTGRSPSAREVAGMPPRSELAPRSTALCSGGVSRTSVLCTAPARFGQCTPDYGSSFMSGYPQVADLLAGGMNIKIVSESLGPRDVSTILRFYALTMPTQQAHLAEVSGTLNSRTK